MGDIKGEMNMYADDISVSETEVKGKLKKIKDSEEYRKFKQNEQRQAEKNGTWMHLEIDSHSSNEEFARCHSGSLYEPDESDDGGAGGCENGGLGGSDKCGDSWV